MNLIEEIIDKIPDDINSDIEKAFYIYLKTCRLFSFDQRLDNVPFWYNIAILYQYVDIRNIKTKNIVCTSWSKIYRDLLEEVGIEADIINTFRHRGVNFKIDNYDIYADATIDKYMDLSRVKHNEPVNRFYTIDGIHYSEVPCKRYNKEFDSIINGVYDKIGYLEDRDKLINFLRENITLLSDIPSKIDYIIENIDLTSYSVMEDAFYFRNVLKKCLDDDYYDVKSTFLKRVNDDGNVDMLTLVVVHEDKKCTYYIFDKLSNIRRCSNEELLEYASLGYGMDINSIYMLKQCYGFEYPISFDVPVGSLKYFYRRNKIKELSI